MTAQAWATTAHPWAVTEFSPAVTEFRCARSADAWEAGEKSSSWAVKLYSALQRPKKFAEPPTFVVLL